MRHILNRRPIFFRYTLRLYPDMIKWPNFVLLVAMSHIRAQDRFDVATEVNAIDMRGCEMNDGAVKRRGG